VKTRSESPVLNIVIPRVVDEGNLNAQNINAKAMLSRFSSSGCRWLATHYDKPDPDVAANPNVSLTRLWRRRLWLPRMWLHYVRSADAVFYPGNEPIDLLGIRWSRRLRLNRPIIATLEGLAGGDSRERQLSACAGHEVCCQRADERGLARIDAILGEADHIIAISPFLHRMGEHLYGKKVSMIPLGVDRATFFPPTAKVHDGRPRVLCAGTVNERKRPEVFFALAERHPEADFSWVGTGPLREQMMTASASRRLRNISFPGAMAPDALAEELRRTSIFAMPSKAEGVPKVIQEALACGVPVVVFGHYEAPCVMEGKNGFIVWSDEEFGVRVSELLRDPALASRMGRAGAEESAAWSWDIVAPIWEQAIRRIAGGISGHA